MTNKTNHTKPRINKSEMKELREYLLLLASSPMKSGEVRIIVVGGAIAEIKVDSKPIEPRTQTFFLTD